MLLLILECMNFSKSDFHQPNSHSHMYTAHITTSITNHSHCCNQCLSTLHVLLKKRKESQLFSKSALKEKQAVITADVVILRFLSLL